MTIEAEKNTHEVSCQDFVSSLKTEMIDLEYLSPDDTSSPVSHILTTLEKYCNGRTEKRLQSVVDETIALSDCSISLEVLAKGGSDILYKRDSRERLFAVNWIIRQYPVSPVELLQICGNALLFLKTIYAEVDENFEDEGPYREETRALGWAIAVHCAEKVRKLQEGVFDLRANPVIRNKEKIASPDPDNSSVLTFIKTFPWENIT